MYRARLRHDEGYSEILFEEFFIIGETQKGFYISINKWNAITKKYNVKKWVPKSGKNPFAFTTKELALNSFVFRKKRHLRILKHQTVVAQKAMEMAKSMLSAQDLSGNRFYHYEHEF